MAIAAMAAMAVRPTTSSIRLLTRQRPKWVLAPTASYSSSSSSLKTRTLVLYSKPGCCLCDGLKEKLQVAFLLSGPNSLHDVVLQVRDITSNPEWERAYQYEIPVLAKVLADGTEFPIPKWGTFTTRAHKCLILFQETLPRISPRLGVEHIQKKIAAALTQ